MVYVSVFPYSDSTIPEDRDVHVQLLSSVWLCALGTVEKQIVLVHFG